MALMSVFVRGEEKNRHIVEGARSTFLLAELRWVEEMIVVGFSGVKMALAPQNRFDTGE